MKAKSKLSYKSMSGLNRKEKDSMSQSKVTAEVFINRPIAEVFEFIKDMNNHAEWQNGVIESRLTSEGSAEVGSTYRYVTQMLGRQIQTEGEVITCDPNKGFFYRSTKAPFQIVGGYTFEISNGGTKVTQRIVQISRDFSGWLCRSWFERQKETWKAI
jgi:uncharacterized protein YndB with AHSA1/START domain